LFDLLRRLFSSDEFMPHAMCFAWRPGVLWLHATSDALIGTAYVGISATMYGLVRRIRLPFSPMIVAFGLFIGACGLTHYMAVYTLWIPDYWLDGGVKVVTAVASVATGVYLFHARPTIVRVTQATELAEERRLRLESTHQELERLYGQMKEMDDAKTRFFANVSHDLRTPLALVLGPVDRLLAGALPEPLRRDLEVVRRNAQLLLHQVNDLLEIARLEEGKLVLSYARVDLGGVLRGVADVFEGAARDRGVRLEVAAPRGAMGEVDPDKLTRALLNLVGNALRYTPEGRAVRCALELRADAAIFAVEDEGPGVPAAERERIFERFARGEASGAAAGTGLGLAIARDLVLLHRGTLAVEDAPGAGARFVLSVPLSAPEGAQIRAAEGAPAAVGPEDRAAAVAPLAAPRDPPVRVRATPRPDAPLALVVEDEPDMRQLLADMLSGEFRVEAAADGQEALAKATVLRPDVVVSDVTMPRLGGDALVRELRRRPETADVPVLLVTARADEPLRLRALREGAADFLVKPVLAEELVARARNLAEAKRSRDTLEGALSVRGGGLSDAARELARRARELESALDATRVAREQAERASQVKSVFLGMVSHELRTPLTSLQLSLQRLSRDPGGALTDAQGDVLRRMRTSVTRLVELVESLLEYTRAETGRLEVRAERFDVAQLAAEVAEELLPQAQQRLLSIGVDPPAGPVPPLESDPRLVRIVLMNLAVNAVKYTDHGGVRLAVTAGPEGHLLEVKDTGPGIPQEDLPRLFEPFEQLGAAQRRYVSGVGLGLSLVKTIVDALGGRIDVRSSPGGSTFQVRLPGAPPARRREGETR
jgi:signal transduction histidine kinase